MPSIASVLFTIVEDNGDNKAALADFTNGAKIAVLVLEAECERLGIATSRGLIISNVLDYVPTQMRTEIEQWLKENL